MFKTLCALVTASILACSTPSVQAQNRPDRKEPATIYAVNAGINGLIGGIGAALNDKNFFEGFAIGALGGVTSTTAKYMVGNDINLAWPAKVLNAVGTSITCNVARGKDPLETIYMDIGPVLLQYKNQEINYSVDFGLTTITIINFCQGYKFDAAQSLRSGTLSFTLNKNYDGSASGYTHGNNILYKIESSDNTQKHELIHAFQHTNALIFASAVSGEVPFEEMEKGLHLTFRYTTGIFLTIPEMLLKYKNRPVEIEAYSLAQ